jgi:UDP-N-acetylglucosamine 2-epimerase (non-hydrolysing)
MTWRQHQNGPSRRIAVVLGTRPEAIKLAPVILRLASEPSIEVLTCSTGQHRDMLANILPGFGISVDSDLQVMGQNQSLAALTARIVERLDLFVSEARPDLLLVQGDTTTAFCAALVAFYRGVPVGHVEAGLRTGNLQAPWPEEANRLLVTRLAALHFAPTTAAAANLLAERVPESTIVVTGNTVVDALYLALKLNKNGEPRDLDFLAELPLEEKFVLITGHRRESFGESFRTICAAIAMLAEEFPATHFIYPVHMNPNVRAPVQEILGASKVLRRNIWLIEPVNYFQFVELLSRSYCILTDSGGIQEEAPSLKKPVLVMRDTTERPEAVQVGAARLVGTSTASIVSNVREVLSDTRVYSKMANAGNPFGDGHAAERIVKSCLDYMRGRA